MTSDAHLPTVEILPRTRAVKRLMSRSQGAHIGCLVSIGDPEQPLPAGFSRPEHRLRLCFHDVVEDSGTELAPTAEDVERLIAFARRIAGTSRRVLVHCEAGRSRSTAAALILYAAWLGPGREADAMAHVLQAVPEATPNRALVRLADALLQRGGALLAAVRARPPEGT